jgi:hypothetical protein
MFNSISSFANVLLAAVPMAAIAVAALLDVAHLA